MTVKGLNILLEVALGDAVNHDEIEAAILSRATDRLDAEQLRECVTAVKLLRGLAYRGLSR